MGQAVPSQHPAVVLRSHFNQLRALLAVALIAVIGLTVAVVILATDEYQTANTSAASPTGQPNYGGFNPTTGRPHSAPPPRGEAHDPITGRRYDGGPEEGSVDVTPARPKVARQQSPPGVGGETSGDYAHGPLPPAAPAKDYSLNGATGEYSTEPEAKSGSRADGVPNEGVNLRAP